MPVRTSVDRLIHALSVCVQTAVPTDVPPNVNPASPVEPRRHGNGCGDAAVRQTHDRARAPCPPVRSRMCRSRRCPTRSHRGLQGSRRPGGTGSGPVGHRPHSRPSGAMDASIEPERCRTEVRRKCLALLRVERTAQRAMRRSLPLSGKSSSSARACLPAESGLAMCSTQLRVRDSSHAHRCRHRCATRPKTPPHASAARPLRGPPRHLAASNSWRAPPPYVGMRDCLGRLCERRCA